MFAADRISPAEEPDAAKPKRAKGLQVSHHWTKDLPLFARAMVLADGTLFVAGPADAIDENQAFKQINDPATRQAVAEQAAVMQGRRGAVLWAVSAADGECLSEHALDAAPVFDGMAAAAGRLYLSTVDGRVVCLAGER